MYLISIEFICTGEDALVSFIRLNMTENLTGKSTNPRDSTDSTHLSRVEPFSASGDPINN